MSTYSNGLPEDEVHYMLLFEGVTGPLEPVIMRDLPDAVVRDAQARFDWALRALTVDLLHRAPARRAAISRSLG